MCCSRKEVGGLALPSIASLDLPSRACAPELAYTLDAMLAPTLTHATRSQPTALKSIRIAPLHMHKQMHKLVMEWAEDKQDASKVVFVSQPYIVVATTIAITVPFPRLLGFGLLSDP